LPLDLRRDAFGFRQSARGAGLNLKAQYPGFRIWAGGQADIDRVTAIWRECLSAYGGPYLFGANLTMADAMYAPVCTRFATYGVALDPVSQAYCAKILEWPAMQEWIAAAKQEPDDIDELEVEF
jgi:glutathione S-transferase